MEVKHESKTDVLTSAMSKIRKFAEGQKNVPGVMLDISGDKMKVCYSDGKKSIIEVIDIEQEEPGVQGRIVVPYADYINHRYMSTI